MNGQFTSRIILNHNIQSTPTNKNLHFLRPGKKGSFWLVIGNVGFKSGFFFIRLLISMKEM